MTTLAVPTALMELLTPTVSATITTSMSSTLSLTSGITFSTVTNTTDFLSTNMTLTTNVSDVPDVHIVLCFFLTFVLGGLAAVISKTIGAPLEKVKIVQQTFLPQSAHDENLSEKNMFSLFRWVYRHMGCLAFWDGNLANCIRYVPKFALDMAIKGELKKGFKSAIKPGDNAGLQFVSKWLSGTIAAFISGIVCYPLDFARTKIAAATDNDSKPTGIIDCWKNAIKVGGFFAIYRGIQISLCGEVVYRGLKYGLYDSIYDWKETGLEDVHPVGDFFLNFLIGWFVSSVAGAVAMPFDTVRRILMIDTQTANPQFDGTVSCIKHIYKTDGITRFWRGTLANVMRSWVSGLCLALFSSLEDLAYANESIQSCRS